MRIVVLFLLVILPVISCGQIVEEVIEKKTNQNEIVKKSITIKLNNKERLPSDINTYSSITIDGYKNVSDINSQLLFHKSLEELTINFDYLGTLTTMPLQIENAVNLKKLIIRSGKLSSIPKGIGDLSNLEVLIIRGNDALTTLPKEIGKLKKLRYLIIDSSKLEKVPLEIGDLLSLEVLSFKSESLPNDIISLPNTIKNLKNLKELNVKSWQLSEIPEGIVELEKLEKLRLNGSFQKLPNSFFNLNNLIELDISSKNLLYIPNGIENLKNLKKISINCSSLQNSNLNFNNLNNLWSVGIVILGGDKSLVFNSRECENLVNLSIEGKKLEKIEGLDNFENLTTLMISYTGLEKIPMSIFKLKKLKRLRISHSKLKMFSKGLLENTNLEEIDFNTNQIAGELPSGLSKLHGLKVVILRSNDKILNIEEIKKESSFKVYY